MTFQPHIAARQTIEAVESGMPLKSARRWPHYLLMKAKRGEQPISLADAVEQCADARRSAGVR